MEIRAIVEEEIPEPFGRSTVKNALARGAKGPNPIYERVGHGRYQLLKIAKED